MKNTQSFNGENYETDIVVVGGGGAGMAAATSAAEKGANVMLLEKSALGGTTAMAQGIFAVESHVQKRLSITTSKDDVFKIAMQYSHWNMDGRIIRAFINKSADTIQWLEDKGIIFLDVPHLYPGQPIRTHHSLSNTTANAGAGAAIIKALREKSEGMGVKIFTHCPATKLFTDEKGMITGVRARTKEGDIEITAKSAIIATGGFGANRELLKKYVPTYHDNLFYGSAPGNTGDGLLMAMEIGADTRGLGNLLLHPQVYSGSRLAGAAARHPAAIWVNKSGIRFTDESNILDFVNPIFNQREKTIFVLFDENIRTLTVEKLSNTRINLHHGFWTNVNQAELLAELQSEASKGGVKIADSWDEMAAWMGADPLILKTSIEEYNSYCDQGYDEIFSRNRWTMLPLSTPPYYGIRCYSSFLTTTGGIRVNEYMQVLDKEEKIIPGLYAGGDSAGGWETDSYCMVLAGHALGFAVNSGRMAGEHAAEFVAGRQ